MRNGVKSRGIVRHRLAGIHGSGTVDEIGDAASWELNLGESLIVEIAGDVEIEIGLVSLEGGFEMIVEQIGEI